MDECEVQVRTHNPIVCDLSKNNGVRRPEHYLFEKKKRKTEIKGNTHFLEIYTNEPDPCSFVEEKSKKGEHPTEDKSDIVVVSPYFVPKCPKEEDPGTGFLVRVKTKRGKTSNTTFFSDSYTDNADPCLFEKHKSKKREHLMQEKSDVVVSPEFAPKFLNEEDLGTGFPVCVKTKLKKKIKDEDIATFSEICTDGPDSSSFEKKRTTNGENQVKEESDIVVVSPYFAKKWPKDEDGNGIPVRVKTKPKMKRKDEDTSSKQYTSVGLRKRVELEPGFLDSDNVEHCASAVDEAMHRAWLDDFFSQFAYTGGTKSCSLPRLKNVNQCNLCKVESCNGIRGVWDKGRVVSPYFVKEAKADLIKQGQKKESITSGKVSPYFSCSKQEDVHLGKVQTEGQKQKRKKSSPGLTKAEKRDEAYRRITQDITWKPPLLKVKLLQHDHASDPWRVLIICMLLNKCGGVQVERILQEFFELCPNAKRATEIPVGDIENVIRTLGLQKKRSVGIHRLSREYLEESWTHVTDLTGVGKYAADAYAIFCAGKWELVRPCDKELVRYWTDLCVHFSTNGTSRIRNLFLRSNLDM